MTQVIHISDTTFTMIVAIPLTIGLLVLVSSMFFRRNKEKR